MDQYWKQRRKSGIWLPDEEPPYGWELIEDHLFADGLVGRWVMNEFGGGTLFDLSGNQNHGTLVNGPVWTATQKGSALYFDRTDDEVEISNSPSLAIPDAVTIAALIKIDQTGIDQKILYEANGSHYWAGIYTNNKLEGAIVSGGTEYYQIRNETGGTVLVADKWYHAVFLFDGRYTKTYINAKLDRTYDTGASRSIDTGSETINLGAQGVGNRGFNGCIARVSLHNRALTEDMIIQLYREFCLMFRPRQQRKYWFVAGGQIYELSAAIAAASSTPTVDLPVARDLKAYIGY